MPKRTSGFRRTNVFGDCKYRAGIQGVTLCEEKPDGTSDCTGTAAIMTSNEGQCIILEIKNNYTMLINQS